MQRVLLLVALLLMGSPTPGGALQRGPGPIRLDAQTRARFLRPGEVVLLTVTPSRPVTALSGTAFGVVIPFWQSGAPVLWRALIGVPLGTTPGVHHVVLRASDDRDVTTTVTVTMNIQAGRFGTRRLRVDDQFADPPPAVAARIAREAATLEGLFVDSHSARLWRGGFGMPVSGPPTSSYGRQTVFNTKPRGRHQGADFKAGLGAPVMAPNSGVVVLAADLYFAGNTVVVDHGGGLVSLFAHLSRTTVQTGDRVARGDLLGEAGASGRVTGPHLHWAVRLHGTSVDPLSLAAAVDGLQDERSDAAVRAKIR